MKTLQEAIEFITYRTKKFPAEEFQIISENQEEAKAVLRASIDYAITEKENLEKDYMLYFYALYFLGEFQDTESFEKIVALASLPNETVDFLLGDAVTEGLSDILYNTYDGNLQLLKDTIKNQKVGDFVRNAMLDVMGQLYLDDVLSKDEWQNYLKEVIYTESEEYSTIDTWIAGMVCQCHLFELLPDVRYLFDEDRIDEYIYGKYDDCVDLMFQYREQSACFCQKPMSADKLHSWSMFEENNKMTNKNFEKQMRALEKELMQSAVKKVKIGRNDPCPCGSGKKYKHCCLNKPKDALEQIESSEKRQKWLKDYPKAASERQEDRIYLEDYFDSESIEIDKLLYLALHHRAIPIWESEDDYIVDKRNREYLWTAFCKYQDQWEQEAVKTSEEYDKKHSIHYRCDEWLPFLALLLNEAGEKEKYDTVCKHCQKAGILLEEE